MAGSDPKRPFRLGPPNIRFSPKQPFAPGQPNVRFAPVAVIQAGPEPTLSYSPAADY